MTETSPSRPTIAQVLLGGFILVQLLFLLLGNLVPFLLSALPAAAAKSVPAASLRAVRVLTDDWVQLTGQGQTWNLFAPLVPMRAMFVTVEIDCPEGPQRTVEVRSGFDPDERGWYLHLPGSDDRLFHYQKELAWPLVAWTVVKPERIAQEADDWQDYLTGQVRKQWRAYRSYLAWASASSCRRPESVVLVVRMYPPSAAGRAPNEQDVLRILLVRWQPGLDAERDGNLLPLDVYDLNRHRFLPLSRGGPPSS
jgi:hypothetical protein